MKFLREVVVFFGAIILGYLVAAVGSLGGLFIFWNLKFLPQIPWLLPATVLWLWAFWRYANGSWWPQSTREVRRALANAGSLSRPVWIWSLIAGGLSFVSAVGIGFLTPRLAEIPREAFKFPIQFSAYSSWMVFIILLAISLIAGVAEEMGYRGYMLSGIQRRFGWIAGTLVTGFTFFMDHHLGYAYATYAFLPFFMLISAACFACLLQRVDSPFGRFACSFRYLRYTCPIWIDREHPRFADTENRNRFVVRIGGRHYTCLRDCGRSCFSEIAYGREQKKTAKAPNLASLAPWRLKFFRNLCCYVPHLK